MTALIKLVKNSIQTIAVPVVDVFENLSTLSGTNPTFDVYTDDDAETHVIDSQVAQNVFLTGICLVDTTSLAEGRYKLFLTFSVGGETPILGPVYFLVDD